MQPRELAHVTACAIAAYFLCSAHTIVPGRIAPSAYAHGCAERFREIISTKMSKTAFREILDPRNISTIRYVEDNTILAIMF